MEYTELIHHYLDGELQSPEEQVLFSELSHNEQLRVDFSHQVKIQSAAQNDISTISTPIESTNAVFAALGFQIPTGNSAEYAGGRQSADKEFSIIKRFRNRFGKYSAIILTALLTSLLTASLSFVALKQIYDSKPTQNIIADNHQSKLPVISSMENPPSVNNPVRTNNTITTRLHKPVMSSITSGVENDGNKNNGNPEVVNTSATENTGNGFNQGDISRATVRYTSVQMLLNSNFANNAPGNLPVPGLSETPTTFIIPSSIAGNGNAHFIVSLNNFSGRSNPTVGPASQSTGLWFANMNASVLYKLTDVQSLGVSVGQEQFAQVFTVDNGINQLRYKQNPMLFWYGLSYKVSMIDLGYNRVLYPYGEVFGGATQAGPLGKCQLGFELKPSDNVSFNLGAELGSLVYNVQNKLYMTNKYAIIYGFSLHY